MLVLSRSFVGVLFYLLARLSTTLSCDLSHIQDCTFSEALQGSPGSLLFVSNSTELRETCMKQTKFLPCALNVVKGCSRKDLVAVHGFQNIYMAVCGEDSQAFNNSRSCIAQLQAAVINHLRPLKRPNKDRCRVVASIRERVKSSAQKQEVCDEQDISLISRLIDLFLLPYVHPEVYNCDLPGFDELYRTTTTTAQTTTTTTQTTTTQTTTTNATGNSEDELREISVDASIDNNSYRQLVAPGVVVILTLLAVFV